MLSMQNIIVIFALMFVLIFSPQIIQASDKKTEKALQRHLEESRQIIGKAKEKAQAGLPVIEDIAKLKEKADDIRQLYLLLDEQFRVKEAMMHQDGKAKQRQSIMAEAYREKIDEYLSLTDSLLPDRTGTRVQLENIAHFLDKIVHKKRLPIHGSLPYTHLNYPSKEPNQDLPITPAYKGGNKIVSPEDLNSTEEAPISEEIAELAQSLNWNPVSIYEYLKNTIETEWYWGCMKGAEETLRQQSGNDCDQAALLVALLRASGFPSRYVRGTIAFFAGNEEPITKVKNLMGIDDPWKIAEFFQKEGIPFRPIITGGSIGNFQIEHIWVESEIPYANYRGAVIDEYGKTWLGLDASVKVNDYQYNSPTDIFSHPELVSGFLSHIRDEYLSAIRTQSPLEYLEAKLSAPGGQELTADSFKLKRSLPPEIMNILPASMQFEQIRITHEYTEIPDDLKHQVRFTATDTGSNELFSITMDAMHLSNQTIALSYEPETVEDQQIIDSYGGLDATPAYLVRLRPVLKINGERMIVAEDGLPMGADYSLMIELISPNGTEKIQNSHITGNLSVIGIVAQKTGDDELLIIDEEDDAETILFKETQNYIHRWNQAEEELASLLHLRLTRLIPTVTTIGGVIDVTYVLDTPHGYEWKGVYCDANLRTIELSPTLAKGGEGGFIDERQTTFMELSALQGSVLEHRIFEDDFGVKSVSTANLFQYAQSIAVPIITIDKTNVSALLPSLSVDDNIMEDIQNSVNQDLTVKIPQSEITYDDWTGIGYSKKNLETGEAGYMLSGMIAGSNSAQTPEQWALQYIVDKLKNPYAGEFNSNPLSATRIVKILATDKQDGTVGKPLPKPLAVLVLDQSNKPVKGATVTFRVIAGGGNFNGSQTHQSLTGENGIAKAEQVPLTLGKYTSDNPYYKKIDSKDEFVTQVGRNIVAASVKSTLGDISMLQPFEEYGKPDKPKEIIKVLGHGNMAMANGPGGSLVAKVVDQYGNPISNLTIQFETMETESRHADVPLPQQYRNVQLYKPAECNISYPLYGECTTVEEIKVKTEYNGAIAGTILGNTVNTKYIVQAETIETELLPSLFELYTEGYRNKDDYIPPGVYIKYQPLVNEKGQPIDAAKTGTQLKAPLVSELFMMYDDYTLQGPNMCSYDPASKCWTLKPTGIVKVRPINIGTVTYTPIQGGGSVTPTENLNNGKYRTKYTTGVEPSLSRVEALGRADIRAPEVFLDPFAVNCSAPQPILMPSFSGTPSGNYKPLCKTAVTEYPETLLQCTDSCKLPESPITLKSGQQVLFQRDNDHTFSTVFGSEHKAEFVVYGLMPEAIGTTPKGIFLDVEGYATHDTTVEYSIKPPNREEADKLQGILEITTDPAVRQNLQMQIDALLASYNAIIADIDIYEREPGSTNPNNDKWLYSLPGSATSGEGTATIFRGTYFNSEKEHYAQVVLNKGSDAEVRGDKVPLAIGQFKMVAYEDGMTPMVGAVTDGAAKIKLQLIAKSSIAAFKNLYWHLVDPQISDYPHSGMGTFMDGENPVTSLPVVFNANGVAEAVYRAPESFVRWGTLEAEKDKELPERYIQPTLDIASYIRTGKDPFAPIHLKRPPVVLVHGLWGNAKAWDIFEQKFNDKGLYENENKIYRVDYSEKGQVRSIVNHVTELQSSIEDAVGKAKKQLLTVGKVDIIAHSLGGLLTREYCRQFDLECQNKIRRFITIDTPHYGSELADLLLLYRDDIVSFPDEPLCRDSVDKFIKGGKIRLTKYIDFLGYKLQEPHPVGPNKSEVNPEGSAIDDLASGILPDGSTTPIGRWKDYPALSGTLRAHTIVGITPGGVDGYNLQIWGLWQFILRRCGYTPENVFGDSNDRIVRKISQQGGLSGNNISEFIETDHFSVRNWPATIVRIKLLLDTSGNSELFSK